MLRFKVCNPFLCKIEHFLLLLELLVLLLELLILLLKYLSLLDSLLLELVRLLAFFDEVLGRRRGKCSELLEASDEVVT